MQALSFRNNVHKLAVQVQTFGIRQKRRNRTTNDSQRNKTKPAGLIPAFITIVHRATISELKLEILSIYNLGCIWPTEFYNS